MSKRLLIIDDALIIREMIKETVCGDGWEVVGEASNGKAGVAAFCQSSPDVVTLDLVMPESSGLEALTAIRERDPAAKVLIVSAIAQSEVLEQTLRLGASDFIVKPFQRTTLLTTLNKLYHRSAPAPASPLTYNPTPGGRA